MSHQTILSLWGAQGARGHGQNGGTDDAESKIQKIGIITENIGEIQVEYCGNWNKEANVENLVPFL